MSNKELVRDGSLSCRRSCEPLHVPMQNRPYHLLNEKPRASGSLDPYSLSGWSLLVLEHLQASIRISRSGCSLSSRGCSMLIAQQRGQLDNPATVCAALCGAVATSDLTSA